jgi:hypothetical protein
VFRRRDRPARGGRRRGTVAGRRPGQEPRARTDRDTGAADGYDERDGYPYDEPDTGDVHGGPAHDLDGDGDLDPHGEPDEQPDTDLDEPDHGVHGVPDGPDPGEPGDDEPEPGTGHGRGAEPDPDEHPGAEADADPGTDQDADARTGPDTESRPARTPRRPRPERGTGGNERGNRPERRPRSGRRTEGTAASRSVAVAAGTTATAPDGALPGAGLGMDPERHVMEKPAERYRLIAMSWALVMLSGLLAMMLLAAVAGLTAGQGPRLGSLLAAAVPLWLAAHQVPLTLGGAPLGVLPLLPTAGMIWLSARVAEHTVDRLGGRWREDGSVVVAALAGANASAAVLTTALPSGAVQATPWAALLGVGLVTAAGAAWGGLRAAGPPSWWYGSPVWLRTGLASARTGGAALLTAGGLLLVAALLVDLDQVRTRVESAGPGFGAMLGITLLSVCYLPNALVAATSWTAGPGVAIGLATASPLLTRPGPLPGLPLMAAMPHTHPPGWTAVVFLLPVLAGVLVGLRCRRLAGVAALRLRAVAVGALTVAVAGGLAAAVVSGRLAGGPFDPVTLPWATLAGALLGWLAVPAAVVTLLPARTRRLR